MTQAARPRALVLRGLHKSFPVGFWRGRRDVLHGLDLELAEGDSLGLVGPNGSGKSTLLRVAAGIERPSAGTLELFGSPPGDAAARARIGYLPEASPYPGELTARAALELVAALRRLSRPERRRRVEAWLDRVGLSAAAGTRLGTFSGGMLRRFGLAAACLHQPDLLLLDEPTAGLDAPGHRVLAEVLDELRARGAALVIASHHLEDVADHTRHMVVLVEGRIVAQGTPEELVGRAGRLRLEVEGLSPDALDELERTIEHRGGVLVARGPAHGSLIELYGRHPGDGPPR